VPHALEEQLLLLLCAWPVAVVGVVGVVAGLMALSLAKAALLLIGSWSRVSMTGWSRAIAIPSHVEVEDCHVVFVNLTGSGGCSAQASAGWYEK